MEVLDSHHVEALAFNNYLSCSFISIINHLWTWLALNFFKLRTVNSPCKPQDHPKNIDGSQYNSHPTALISSPLTPLVHETTTTIVFSSICSEVATKGRFTAVYYEEKRETTDEVVEKWSTAVENEWDSNSNGGVCGWEVVRMKMRDDIMSWNDFQDLKLINGNVVRLWDDFRKSSQAYK